jgi:hypothetical protein
MRWWPKAVSAPQPGDEAERGMTFTHDGSVWRIMGLHKKNGNKWKPVSSGKKGSPAIHASASLLRKNALTGCLQDVDPTDLLSSSTPHSKNDVRNLYIRLSLDKVKQWGYMDLTTYDLTRENRI